MTVSGGGLSLFGDDTALLRFNAALAHLGQNALIQAITAWPGLALLTREDGSVIAAANAWATIGIPPEDLKQRGWAYYVVPEDANRTQKVTRAIEGPEGQTVTRFRNTYRSDAGETTVLEWHASTYGTEGVTLALAHVTPSPTDAELEKRESRRAHHVDAMLSERKRRRWREQFATQSDGVVRWVADLKGTVLFSEGDGKEPDSFVGINLCNEDKVGEAFFSAVQRLLEPQGPSHFTLFTAEFLGNQPQGPQRYLNVYTLVRLPSGRPHAVAVLSVEFSHPLVHEPLCGIFKRRCPLVAKGPL